MNMKLAFAAVLTAFAGPVAAATLDFTSNSINTGLSSTNATAFGSVTYTVSASAGGTLTNSTHKTNQGCAVQGQWTFECDQSGSRYDVGFGVNGPGSDNTNEVDGQIRRNEYVIVEFSSMVEIDGFAGMLTYDDSRDGSVGTETVVLEYWNGTTWVNGSTALPINDDNDPSTSAGPGTDNKFNTVGLAYEDDLSLFTTKVRITAGGIRPFDDGNANVTLAGLMVSSIPVPAALPLLLGALGALGWAGRRKKRKAA
jgi:hypothetical protein